jgi:spore maturation protein CgeB
LKNDFIYDLVWIDKGVFIDPRIINILRKGSTKLVHFTPDPAFTYHQSELFYEALGHYDYCITTKSFEIPEYRKHGVNTIFCTQGYDPELHKPYHDFSQKNGVVFIGHKEDEREEIIGKLIEMGVRVTIAGNHWDKFAAKRKKYQNLVYKGKGLFGDDYAKEISGAKIGLGLLSKWVPELHTTRTFEIPACRTALVSELNTETQSIFKEDEVLFYKDIKEMVEKVEHYLAHPELLKNITEKGFAKVQDGEFSYNQILKKLLKEINV